MSKSDIPLVRAPLLGEHTEEVLSDDLALSAVDMQEVEAAGIIGGEPVFPAK